MATKKINKIDLLSGSIVFITTSIYPNLAGHVLEGFDERGKAFIFGSNAAHDYEFILPDTDGKRLNRDLDVIAKLRRNALEKVNLEYDNERSILLRDFPNPRKASHEMP